MLRLHHYKPRHTHASLLINEGVHPKRISERLSHSSIQLTMDTYGHLFGGEEGEAAWAGPEDGADRGAQGVLSARIRPRSASAQGVLSASSRRLGGSVRKSHGCSPTVEIGALLCSEPD